MTWAVVLAAAVAVVACKGEEPAAQAPAVQPQQQAQQQVQAPTPAAPAPAAVPAEIGKMRNELQAVNIAVNDVKQLPGHTMPRNCAETWRYRLYFGDREFLNVNQFADEAAARACFEEYKGAVMKGGQAAWDRLGPLTSSDGAYLFQFSEAMTDANRRDAILAAVKKGR